jgi:hypothetical protein
MWTWTEMNEVSIESNKMPTQLTPELAKLDILSTLKLSNQEQMTENKTDPLAPSKEETDFPELETIFDMPEPPSPLPYFMLPPPALQTLPKPEPLKAAPASPLKRSFRITGNLNAFKKARQDNFKGGFLYVFP